MKPVVAAPARIPLRQPAPHVRAAILPVAQPRRVERPSSPPLAAHTRAAVAQARMPVADPRAAVVPPHPSAAHVRAAVAQAKPSPGTAVVAKAPAPPARHLPVPAVRPRPASPQPPTPVPPRAVPTAIQPYAVHGNYKVSTSTDFAVRAHNNRLYRRVGSVAAMPNVYNWTWQAAGAQVTINGIQYQPYQATQANGTGVALPSDCIKAAQIVMGGVRSAAGTAVADLNGLAEPNYRGGGSVSGALGGQPPVGSAYLIVHSRTAGDFHTAAVIRHDGTDNITLEADVDDPMTFRQNNLLFDMYNEATGGQSFWSNQGGSATDRVWRVDLPAAAAVGTGTLLGDIQDRMTNAQQTRLGQVMA
jgi:hypothetical protein